MNKKDLVKQCTPEQLADMVIRYKNASEVKNDEICKLMMKISNLKESNDKLQQSVDTKDKEKEAVTNLKAMLENENIFGSIQDAIYSMPDDKTRKLENTIENIDNVLWELFGVDHNVAESPVTFKQILEKRLEMMYGDKERFVKKKCKPLCNGLRYCPTCGEKIKSYYKFCTECGQAILRLCDTYEGKKV